jgi:hypothetical protein
MHHYEANFEGLRGHFVPLRDSAITKFIPYGTKEYRKLRDFVETHIWNTKTKAS